MIREIRVNDNPGSVTDFGRYSGVIRDGNNAVVTNNGIRKSGDGLLELTNTNTYTGQTIVDAGTLRVTGSISASTVQVNSGGTLDGTGNGTTTGITGPVNVASGGKIAPGTSVGLLSTGSVSLTTGATLSMEVNGTSPLQYDQLSVTGTVALGSGTLSLSGTFNTGGVVTNDLFFLILNDGGDPITGTFAGIPNGGTVLAVNGQDFIATYFADSVGETFTGGNDFALQAVPEPGAALSLLGGLGVLVAMRRRRS